MTNFNQMSADLPAASRRQIMLGAVAGLAGVLLGSTIAFGDDRLKRAAVGEPGAKTTGKYKGQTVSVAGWATKDGSYAVQVVNGKKEQWVQVKPTKGSAKAVGADLEKARGGQLAVLSGGKKAAIEMTMTGRRELVMQFPGNEEAEEFDTYLADWAVVAIVAIITTGVVSITAILTGSSAESTTKAPGGTEMKVSVNAGGGGDGVDGNGDGDGDSDDNNDGGANDAGDGDVGDTGSGTGSGTGAGSGGSGNSGGK